MDLDGLEDDPDFWKMDVSEGSDDNAKVEPKSPNRAGEWKN